MKKGLEILAKGNVIPWHRPADQPRTPDSRSNDLFAEFFTNPTHDARGRAEALRRHHRQRPTDRPPTDRPAGPHPRGRPHPAPAVPGGRRAMATARRPSKLFRNLSAKIASIPMILTAARRLPRRHALDGRLFLHQLQAAAAAELRRPRPVRAALGDAALADLDREPRDLRRPVADLLAGDRLHARRAARPEDPLREHLPHHLPLSLRALLHRHRPRLAVDAQPRLRHAARRPQRSAGRASPSTRSTTPTSSSTAS